MKTTKVTVSTRDYEFSHGRTPKGQGNWVFIFPNNTIDWFRGTYTEARKAAIARAKSQGFTSIDVGA